MEFKSLLKDRIVQVLLFVIALNAVAFVLVWRLDIFVHKDLYNYGLIFSYDWAADYWYYSGLLWSFLPEAITLSALSIIPHRQHSQKTSKTTKILCALLPTLAITYQTLCIWSLTQIDAIVKNRLYDYGIPSNFNWATTYNPISATALVFMVTALIALIIPTIRTFDIIEIERTKEE